MKMNRKIHYFLAACLSLIFTLTFFTACQDDSVEKEPIIEDPVKEEGPVADGTYTIYTIVSKLSGKVLDVEKSSTVSGANVMQWSATNGSNQKWTFTYNEEGFYTIVSVNSGMALAVEAASLVNGGNIIQESLSGGTAQQWQIVDGGDGFFKIINRGSGKLLDVWEAASFESANIAQWEENGGANQEWSFTKNGEGGSANGQLKWQWVSTAGIPSDAKSRIDNAMDAAVARYNKAANWGDRTLSVEYNTGVATADATIVGYIRFGPSADFQNERTALHEIAHTWGVGSSWKWDNLIQNYLFVGARANKLIKFYDGVNAVINTGGGHFWPYGLNYNSEISESNFQRHTELVSAMVKDGMY